MINVVLFDLGNVILPFDVFPLANKLSQHSSLPPAEILNHLWPEGVAEEFETGRMTPAQYFETVKNACHLKNLTFDEFVPIFNDVFVEDIKVMDIIQRLKPHNTLGLISNTNVIHANYIMQRYPIMSLFDHTWFSNVAGVRKPAPAVYHMVLDHFHANSTDCVFIDDTDINVDSAKSLGMNGIYYRNPESLELELKQLGVKIDPKAP